MVPSPLLPAWAATIICSSHHDILPRPRPKVVDPNDLEIKSESKQILSPQSCLPWILCQSSKNSLTQKPKLGRHSRTWLNPSTGESEAGGLSQIQIQGRLIFTASSRSAMATYERPCLKKKKKNRAVNVECLPTVHKARNSSTNTT